MKYRVQLDVHAQWINQGIQAQSQLEARKIAYKRFWANYSGQDFYCQQVKIQTYRVVNEP